MNIIRSIGKEIQKQIIILFGISHLYQMCKRCLRPLIFVENQMFMASHKN